MAKFEVFLKSGKKEKFTKRKKQIVLHSKKKKCRDQDSNLGYCGHNAMY